MTKTLIVIPSVPMVVEANGYFLDIKAIEGLRKYAENWPGQVTCIMRLGNKSDIAFGQLYQTSELPFKIVSLAGDINLIRQQLNEADIILASGDNYLDLELVNVTETPVVFIIENILITRLKILFLTFGLRLKTVKSAIWTILTERKRRSAFRHAAGLQANGTPAFDAYGDIAPSSILYFDSRVNRAQQITQDQALAKAIHIEAGNTLRLAFSGRLERLKGADHLIPVILGLANRGVRFSFDIFGDGSLLPDMKAAVQTAGLQKKVHFHGAVSFDDVLVPAMKKNVDLFVCCHRQSDPSCTYIETLACGVPIVGYDNAALAGFLRIAEFGISVPMDNPQCIVEAIAMLDEDRVKLTSFMHAAMQLASIHSFEATFLKRIEHIKSLLV